MPVAVRRYAPTDAGATLEVFRRAVHVTASADYTAAQREAWAPHDLDVEGWATRQDRRNAVVAEIDGQVVGFSDVDAQGYVDMLFVDPDHTRQGVATTLMHWVRTEAARLGATRLWTHASETARPFFEAHGFGVDEHRTVVLRGVTLTNYRMSRVLDEEDG